MICPTAKAKYFFSYDWTDKITLIFFKKFRFTRKWLRSRFRPQAARRTSQFCRVGKGALAPCPPQ
jgi:hypothetical protein